MKNNNQKVVLFVLSDKEFKTVVDVREYFNNIKAGSRPDHEFHFNIKKAGRTKGRRKQFNENDLMLFLYKVKGEGRKIYASCRVSESTTDSDDGDYFFYFGMDVASLGVYEDGLKIEDILVNEKKLIEQAYKNMTPPYITDSNIIETMQKKLESYAGGAYQLTIKVDNLGDLKKALLQFRQVIFQGPPGTSKTWEAKKLTAHLLDINVADKGWESMLAGKRFAKIKPNFTEGCWDIVQFHPSYNYEDFVRGIQIKPLGSSGMKYEAVNRIICNMADAAKRAKDAAKSIEDENKNSPPPFILIIDEINRANLAAVLGELIYALEYRGEDVSSPYAIDDEHAICIPKNLYIIGTMNTADRSVGHIDYAVRRRFAFESFLPSNTKLDRFYDELQAEKNIQGPRECAKKLFDEIEKLFNGDNLSPEFNKDDVQIGHTYFMAESEEKLFNKFIYQVYPIVREYYKDGVFTSSRGRLNIPGLKIEVSNPVGNDILLNKLHNFCSQNRVPDANDDTNYDNTITEQQNGKQQDKDEEAWSDDK